MNPRVATVVLGILAAGAAREASAQDCTPVRSLPFRIDAPGHYCLQSNLVWPTELATRQEAAAIEIAADDVLLDLAGFRLLGPGRGRLNGIQAWNRERVTVRNGSVAGFFVGVALRENGRAPASPRRHVVEGLRVLRSGGAGLHVQGGGSRVEGNVVDGVDGTAGRARVGIVVEGARQAVVDNDVIDVSGGSGFEGEGIVVRDGSDAVVRGNRVTGPGSGWGCGVSVSASKGVRLVGNRFAGLRAGHCGGLSEAGAQALEGARNAPLDGAANGRPPVLEHR